MQERRDDRLLDLARFQADRLLLNLSRPVEFPCKDRRPRDLAALVFFRIRHRHEFAHRFGQFISARSIQQHGRPNQRAIVPFLRFAQGLGESAEYTPGPLKAAQLRPASHRGEIVRLSSGITIVDDSYNANPTATKAALAVLAGSPASRRIAVIGEMLELGDRAAELHQDVDDARPAGGWSHRPGPRGRRCGGG